jgi:hypothetical protein
MEAAEAADEVAVEEEVTHMVHLAVGSEVGVVQAAFRHHTVALLGGRLMELLQAHMVHLRGVLEARLHMVEATVPIN